MMPVSLSLEFNLLGLRCRFVRQLVTVEACGMPRTTNESAPQCCLLVGVLLHVVGNLLTGRKPYAGLRLHVSDHLIQVHQSFHLQGNRPTPQPTDYRRNGVGAKIQSGTMMMPSNAAVLCKGQASRRNPPIPRRLLDCFECGLH
jgi:hypothetical protein